MFTLLYIYVNIKLSYRKYKGEKEYETAYNLKSIWRTCVTLCMCMLAYTVIFAILYTCLKLYKSYTDKICRVFSFIELNTKKYDSKVVLALFSNKDMRSTLIKTFIEPLNNLLITAKSFNTKEKKMKFYEEVVEVKIDEFVNAMQDEYNKLKLQDESVIDAFKDCM